MRSSTQTTAAVCAQNVSPRVWFCFILLFAFVALSASAQTDITATTATSTVQYMGVPNPQQTTLNAVTAPLGGIVIKGTGISPITGQPFRHLWVADATAGICRVDPDLDSPGPYQMNLDTCPFKINGASITGGPMAFDPTRNFLYFADEQRSSQGVMRIGYLPGGDNGHGLLNFDSLFIMGGNTTGARFGGGTTGCPFPFTVTGPPSSIALSPLGDLWVGFKKETGLVRFNSPGTADATGFGTCAQFIQQVGTVNKITNGLAWIGHDLWGADGTSPFFIKNADTLCAVPPHGQCTLASGDLVNVLGLAAVAANVTATMSDQYYPAINGNNVYFTLAPAGGPDNVAWLGNASVATAAMTGTTLDTGFFGLFNPPAGPAAMGPQFAIQNLNGLGVDASDPANLVVYSSDDYSGLGTLANGMWFQSCQGVPSATVPGPPPTPYILNCPTPVATAVPGVPQNVVGVASNSLITLSWSPAQSHQPVTSYTVLNTSSTGAVIPTFTVTPVAGSAFPPTSVAIPAVNGTTYTFQVAASNASGTSAFSTPSGPITPPGTQAPNAPTVCSAQPCAVAGDTQAFVSWTISAPNGTPITSYTITAYVGGVSTGITANVPPPASGNTGTGIIAGLTNGTIYTFTVHANNVAGSSIEGPMTNSVIPSASNLPTLAITMNGPTSVTSTPVQLTFGVTVQNTSRFAATNVALSHTLSTIGAPIAAGGAVRDASGNVTITTTSAHFLSIGESVTIAGVGDASFNGTFTISNVPSPTTFTFSQALAAATSGGGTATGLPTANIMLAQPGQGSCTAGGAGVISVSCTLGNLDPGASVTVNVIVQMQNQGIINSATASGTDTAGTVLVNANVSKTTAPPQPVQQNISTAVGITGNAQNPNPNVGQAGNITWTISNTTTTPAPNVVVTLFTPNGLTINAPNPPSVTIDNGGVGSCAAGTPVTVNGIAGTQFVCSVTATPANPQASLGGPRKNGAKPPSTMIITQNVTATVSKAVYRPTATVSFGPGGTDTLPSSATVTITVR